MRGVNSVNKLHFLVCHDRKRTSLVFNPGGLKVLYEVEEVLIGHCALSGHNRLWVWGSLVIDARAL